MKEITKYLRLSVVGAAVVATGCFTSCKKDEFKVNGNIEGGADRSVVLEKASFDGRWMAVDSARVGSNGKFEIESARPSAPEIYRLALGDRYIYLPVDSTETLTVNAKAADFGREFTVTGSAQAENMANFEKELMALNFDNQADREAFKKTVYSKYLKDSRGGILSYYVLTKTVGDTPDVILRFMDADDATQALARRYFNICVWAAPAVTATLGISGWLLGMQNSRATMVIAIATNIVNVVLSIGLVFGAGWKIEGVATGTMVAQWFGALLGLGIIAWKYRPAFPGLRSIFESTALRGFFRINTDIMLRTACLVAVTMWFTHAGATQSTAILAANALLLQLFMLFSFFMDGFAFSGEALAGKFHGAGNPQALRELIADILRVGLWCAVIFAVLYCLLGEAFLRVLADDQSVVATAVAYLPWAVAIPLCGFMAFAWDGILIGLTRTRIMLAAMALAMITFFALYFSLFHRWGNHALWLAFDAYLTVRGAAEWIIWRKSAKRAY